MLKRVIEILVIIAAMAVMTLALLNRSNTKSLLFEEQSDKTELVVTEPQPEPQPEPTDSLTATQECPQLPIQRADSIAG